MEESLVLFESIINSRWFLRTSVILLLTKVDVLKDKLPKVIPSLSFWANIHLIPLQSPLEKYFPEYTGGADINKAAKYILWRFMQVNRAKLSIYPQSVSLPFLQMSWLTTWPPVLPKRRIHQISDLYLLQWKRPLYGMPHRMPWRVLEFSNVFLFVLLFLFFFWCDIY